MRVVLVQDKTYLVRFKSPDLGDQIVVAATIEVHGEHIVFLNYQGKLTALFLTEIVEGWDEFEPPA